MKTWVLGLLFILSFRQAFAGFCGFYFGKIVSARPQSFSSKNRETAEVLAAAKAFRQNYKGDPDQSSPELIPIAQSLLRIVKAAKPFSLVSNERSAQFDYFITEVLLKIETQKVSLKWLLTYSYRLSFLFVDPYNVPEDAIREKIVLSKDWMRHQSAFNTQFSLAPILLKVLADKDVLALPMPEGLSLFEINRLTRDGIAPLFQKKKLSYLDGREYFVDEAWDRDASRVEMIPHSKEFRNYAKSFLEEAERWSPAERAQDVFYLSYLTHEEHHQNLGPSLSVRNLSLLFVEEFRNDGTGQLIDLAVDTDGFAPLLKSQGVNVKNRAAVKAWLKDGFGRFVQLHQSLIENP